MKRLLNLVQKRTRIVIGLMSGTSVDGIDAALVEIDGNGIDTKLHQIDFVTLPFPEGFKEFVLKNSTIGSSDVADIARLNFLLAQLYAEAVLMLCKHAGINFQEVDLIGTHGQTIHHLPQRVEMFGKPVAATLQIGDPSVVAKLTGIITIGDFRAGDVALGGQGAPLVPYFDYLLFRSDEVSRMLLNIGGIANVSYLPKGCRENDVLAFDTGPGNMIVDQLMQISYKMDFDRDGAVASSGNIQREMLSYLMTDEFVTSSPPKSTGRERYGKKYVEDIINKFGDQSKEDIIATITEFTPAAVHENFRMFLSVKGRLDELYVSGGGAHSRYMMDSLKAHFPGVRVENSESLGIPSDAKEAICFAVLANETVSGNATNLPQVTGASRATILGKICLP
ncbi:MAG TPA: anhydro-N-acetylmuramic acid kinase [Candidatus Acidoferrales bacterium]|nr:anhydro-N-acetylmuramic acid kinase [Candidatus Acidoferrales bacterium]